MWSPGYPPIKYLPRCGRSRGSRRPSVRGSAGRRSLPPSTPTSSSGEQSPMCWPRPRRNSSSWSAPGRRQPPATRWIPQWSPTCCAHLVGARWCVPRRTVPASSATAAAPNRPSRARLAGANRATARNGAGTSSAASRPSASAAARRPAAVRARPRRRRPAVRDVPVGPVRPRPPGAGSALVPTEEAYGRPAAGVARRFRRTPRLPSEHDAGRGSSPASTSWTSRCATPRSSSSTSRPPAGRRPPTASPRSAR